MNAVLKPKHLNYSLKLEKDYLNMNRHEIGRQLKNLVLEGRNECEGKFGEI